MTDLPCTPADEAFGRTDGRPAVTGGEHADPAERSTRANAYASASVSNAVKWSVVQLIAASHETSEVCEALTIDRGELERRVRENEIHAFTVDGIWLFPGWQFTEDDMIPFVPEICERAAGMSAAVLSGFMGTVQGGLSNGGQAFSPRDWLRLGRDPDRVLGHLDSRRYR